ncbi:hypothetical protein ACS0TY_027463 [Phlomoides rotata]
MKVMTFNVRSMGNKMKRQEVRRIIKETGVDMCCLQETKLDHLEERLGSELWPGKDFDWVGGEAEGRAGGLISIWNRKAFVKTSSWHHKGLLVVNGRWSGDNVQMVILNVYATGGYTDKAQLWDMIRLVIEQNADTKSCVVGDFNSIREEGERCGRGGVIDRRDIKLFDDFISLSGLIDLQLGGQKYLWYKPDGSCKSRLDRVLVNEEWVIWKLELKLKSLGRSVSDHCPLFLSCSITNWGPKPFKFFNSWVKHPEFSEFCLAKWKSYSVTGWKSYALMEKLKLLKRDLKVWSRETFGAIQQKMENQRDDIDRLDIYDEVFGLEDEEIIERNRIGAELKRNMIWNNKFLFQKARSKWFKEGDMNSSFFHRWINKRIKINGIEGLFDIWYWNGEPDGEFTVKKAYKLLATVTENSIGLADLEAFRMLWKSSATRRSQSIGWKILKMRLPTRDELKKRGIIPEDQDSSCPCCEEKEETISHLFFDCNFARSIWHEVYKWTNCCMVSHIDPIKHLLAHSSILGNGSRMAVAIWNSVVDLIWRSRNDAVFQNIKVQPKKIFYEVKALVWSWVLVQEGKKINFSFDDWNRNSRICASG